MSVLKELINANNSLSQGKSTKVTFRAKVMAGEGSESSLDNLLETLITEAGEYADAATHTASVYQAFIDALVGIRGYVSGGDIKRAQKSLDEAIRLNNRLKMRSSYGGRYLADVETLDKLLKAIVK